MRFYFLTLILSVVSYVCFWAFVVFDMLVQDVDLFHEVMLAGLVTLVSASTLHVLEHLGGFWDEY